MKFAHNFKETLQRECFPAYWVESAIPYGQLKKCIKKVEDELRSVGLDSETLAHLVPLSLNPEVQQVCRGSRDAPAAFRYKFAGIIRIHLWMLPKLMGFNRETPNFPASTHIIYSVRR
jgi:E3 ubiquitin-protein ligase BAH